jgi:hypothetical protein
LKDQIENFFFLKKDPKPKIVIKRMRIKFDTKIKCQDTFQFWHACMNLEERREKKESESKKRLSELYRCSSIDTRHTMDKSS